MWNKYSVFITYLQVTSKKEQSIKVFTNATSENEAVINGDACDMDHCNNDQYPQVCRSYSSYKRKLAKADYNLSRCHC